MHEEITATYKLDADTMLPAFKWNARRKRWLLGVLVAVFSLPVVAGIVGSIREGGDVVHVVVVSILPFVLMLPLLWFALGPMNRFFWRKRIQAMPVHGKVIRWFMTDENLKHEAGDSTSVTPWSMILESVATPDGCLIYPQKNLFYWFPKFAFSSGSDEQRFLDLLAAKTKHTKLG